MDGKQGHESALHIDIYSPVALGKLREIVDIDDPARIMIGLDLKTYREGIPSSRSKETR
jgi:hypothetical protein